MARKTKAELEAEAAAAAEALAELEAAGDEEDDDDGESSELDDLMRQAAEEGAEIGDDEIDIDLSEAETYEAFTAKVPVEITAAVAKQGPKARYLELKLRVFEGEFVKRVLWTNINITGKGAGFGIEKLAAFGAKSKDGTLISSKNTKVFPAGLVGLKAVAACAPDTREEYKHKVVVGKITTYVSAEAEEASDLK